MAAGEKHSNFIIKVAFLGLKLIKILLLDTRGLRFRKTERHYDRWLCTKKNLLLFIGGIIKLLTQALILVVVAYRARKLPPTTTL